MKKWVVAVGMVLLLATGYGIGWFRYHQYPIIVAAREARQQQEQLNRMARHGQVIKVEPGAITIKNDKKVSTYQTNDYTSIQIGTNYVSKPGAKPDLTKYFNKKDQVNLLVKDGQAVLIHREFRKGETIPRVPTN